MADQFLGVQNPREWVSRCVSQLLELRDEMDVDDAGEIAMLMLGIARFRSLPPEEAAERAFGLGRTARTRQ
jgi:hypothetical protein